MTNQPFLTDSPPTPASEWRKTVRIALPSGRVVELRPTDISLFLQEGEVPNYLVPVVEQALTGNMSAVVEHIKKQSVMEAFQHQRELMERFAVVAVASPKVVLSENPDVEKGEISVKWMLLDDLGFIFQYMLQPTLALKPFSEETLSSMESLRADQNIGTAPSGVLQSKRPRRPRNRPRR